MKRIAVIRGGPSEEHAASMKTGAAVLKEIPGLGYQPKDIVISRQGEWLDQGKVLSPLQILEGVDLVFNALHGTYGEDGQLQRELERIRMPYTGSRALASSLGFNKAATKEILKNTDILTPKHRVLEGSSLWSVANDLDAVVEELGEALFVKPTSNGSSVATFPVFGRDQLAEAAELLLPKYEGILVEERIFGREVTVGVLEHFRDHEHYPLPLIEITPAKGTDYLDNESKHTGAATYSCPAALSFSEKEELGALAIAAHTAVGCKDYSRSDFILRDGVPYFLEINTHPGLTEVSLFPKAAKSVGISMRDIVEHLINRTTS